MVNDAAHRRKANEEASLIESQKTHFEKFGEQCWRFSLRRDKADRIVNFTPMKTSPATNIYISTNQSPVEEVEIIQNPHQRRGQSVPRKRAAIEQKVQSLLGESAKKKKKAIFVPDARSFEQLEVLSLIHI